MQVGIKPTLEESASRNSKTEKLTIFLEHSMRHTAKRNGLVNNINKSNTSQFLFLLDRAYQIFKKNKL